MSRDPEENRGQQDLAVSKGIPAVPDLSGLVELSDLWGLEGLRESVEMWGRKVILVKSGFRVFREIQGRSDQKGIKDLSDRKVIQDPQDRLDLRGIAVKKVIVALPGNRGLPDCRVSRVNLAPRVCRATGAVLGLRENKESPGQKEILESRGRKEIRVTPALKGKRVILARKGNRVFKSSKVTPVIPDLKGRKATKAILANRASKDLRVRRVIPARHQPSQLLRILPSPTN